MADISMNENPLIKNSEIGSVKLYRNVVIDSSKIDDFCSIGDDTTVERSTLEKNVILNRRSYVNDSVIKRFTYAGINTIINWAKIGQFCSIGQNVAIGGADHDYKKVTTMPSFRFAQMQGGGGKLEKPLSLSQHCEIGNDVWIAAGVQILGKARIGDGAVIGAGAVVTRDIPPYAIAVGVPAKVIGYRFEQPYRDALQEIKWWNWPEESIQAYFPYFMEHDISDTVIAELKKVSEQISAGLPL